MLSEDADDAFNAVEQLAKRDRYISAFEDLSLSERYAEGEMGMCVVFEFVKRPPGKFVAVFNGKESLVRKLSRRDWWAGIVGNFIKDGGEIAGDGNDCAVFVYDVESPEVEKITAFSSAVRLHHTNDRFGIGTNPIEELARSGVVQPVRSPMYREVCFAHYLFCNGNEATKLNQAGRK
jgi:hypothetical protein